MSNSTDRPLYTGIRKTKIVFTSDNGEEMTIEIKDGFKFQEEFELFDRTWKLTKAG